MNLHPFFLYLTGTLSVILSIYIYFTLFIFYKKHKDSIPIKPDDITDRQSFLSRLKNHSTTAIQKLWNSLDEESIDIIKSWNPYEDGVNETQWDKIIDRLNFIMADYYFYDEDSFKDIEFDGDLEDFPKSGMESLKADKVKFYNRILLEKICPELRKCYRAKNPDIIDKLFGNRILSKMIPLVVILIGVLGLLTYLEIQYQFLKLFSVFYMVGGMEKVDSGTIIIRYIQYLFFNGIIFFSHFNLIFWGGFALFSQAKFSDFIRNQSAQFLSNITSFLIIEASIFFFAPRFFEALRDLGKTFRC